MTEVRLSSGSSRNIYESINVENFPAAGANDVNSTTINISIPDLDIQIKNLKVNCDDTLWQIKQHAIHQCSKANTSSELKDSLNYGLYVPPQNGRAGKFLDEERLFNEYSLSPGCTLELKYKKREYKQANIKQRKIVEFNSKTYRKKCLHYVRLENVTKLTKLFHNGLDPNFQDDETGETPLTSAAIFLSQPLSVMMALVEGGAHLDYRNRIGFTAMHRAAQNGKKSSIRALLDLGASPNSKDEQGLTPLYHCVSSSVEIDGDCVEMLLSDFAQHGVTDVAGSTELHQACRHGRTQHLEHLLYYGADPNVMNKTGNTPLHVCALNNQESCARILLFRGADKTLRNYANQDAMQLAQLCGHSQLAILIEQFSSCDAVPYKEKPKFKILRKSVLAYATQSRASTVAARSSNLVRMKSISLSSPQLLDLDDDERASSKKSKRQRQPKIESSTIGPSGGLSHAVGVPTIAQNGRIFLNFMQSSAARKQYDSDSPCLDDNSSIGSFDSDISSQPVGQVVSSPIADIYANLDGYAVTEKRSGVSAAVTASSYHPRGSSPNHEQQTSVGQRQSADDKTASIRTFHKRLTASNISEDTFNIFADNGSRDSVNSSNISLSNLSILTSPANTTGRGSTMKVESVSPEYAQLPRRSPIPPPPVPKNKTNFFESSSVDINGGHSSRPVLKRFGSADNLLDCGDGGETSARTLIRPAQNQVAMVQLRTTTIGRRYGSQENLLTNDVKPIDWKQIRASQIAQSPPSQSDRSKPSQLTHQPDSVDDDLPPPPDPSLFNFASSRGSELRVYGSLPTETVKNSPQAETNMKAAADVLLKKFQGNHAANSSGIHRSRSNDDLENDLPTPPPLPLITVNAAKDDFRPANISSKPPRPLPTQVSAQR